jgi:hypothetical protein
MTPGGGKVASPAHYSPTSVVAVPPPVHTTKLTQPITANSYILNVPDVGNAQIGHYITVGDPNSITSETRKIVAFGSIILDKPLTNAYPANTPINVYTTNPVSTPETPNLFQEIDTAFPGLEKAISEALPHLQQAYNITVPNLQKQFHASNNSWGATPNVYWNDYMLKTQIVPPICPACPACPNFTGNCLSCGNKGGSNFTPSSNDHDKDKHNDHDKDHKEHKNESNFVEDAGRGTKNFIENTGSGAKDFIEDTGKGIKDLLYDTGRGAKDLLYDTGRGAKDLLYDTGRGAKDLAYDTGRGGKDLAYDIDRHANNISRQYLDNDDNDRYGKRSQHSGPMNPYTYNGALSQKPSSNFIPLTADFSKFGR